MSALSRVFAACGIAAAVFCGPASAALVELEWHGTTVFGGADGLNLFGLQGINDVGGYSYVATFVFDTTIGFTTNGTNGVESVDGGTIFDPDLPSPLVSASVTINGMTYNADGRYESFYTRQGGQGASQLSTLAQRLIDGNPQPFGGELFQRVFRVGEFYGQMLAEEGHYTFDVADAPGGQVLVFNRDPAGDFFGPGTQIQLVPTELWVRGAVPEPSAAVLVAAGVAAASRRRSPRCRH